MKVINFMACSLEPFDEILELKFKGCQVQIMVLWLASTSHLMIHKLETLSACYISNFYFIDLQFVHL